VYVRPRRQLRGAAILLLAAGLLLVTAVPALADTATPNNPAATNAAAIDTLWRAVLGVTVTIFVLVGGWLLYTSIRFRERPGDTSEPPQIHGSTRLEMAWTVVPVLILIGLAGYVAYKLPAAENISSSPNAIKVHVTAQQFTFSYTYEATGKPPPGSALIVPVNVPVVIDLTTKDVNHDWWVPALAPKVDAIPGQTNHTGFTPTRTGTFSGQCAEFCGPGHAGMTITVQVVSTAAWNTKYGSLHN
jgi:cytochrome c oxidase subunit II